MVAEMFQKYIFIFNFFCLKNHVYLYSIKKLFFFSNNFVIQRKYIYIQSKHTCVLKNFYIQTEFFSYKKNIFIQSKKMCSMKYFY